MLEMYKNLRPLLIIGGTLYFCEIVYAFKTHSTTVE